MPVCRFEGRAVRTTALVIWRCTLGSGGVACGNYFWRERVREVPWECYCGFEERLPTLARAGCGGS